MDEKAKKKGRKDSEVMNGNVADDKEVEFLDDSQENGKTRKDDRLKSNEGEDDDQGKPMKKKKKKRSAAESQHEDCNEDKDDSQYKKEKEEKKRKKKKLSEESKSKETHYYEFESNEGGDGDQGKKMKKKKLSEESKIKENYEFNSKVMKKEKKSDAASQLEDHNEFKSNEDKDDSQCKKEKEEKKRKKKKLSEESKSKEHNEFKSNEGEDDGQAKKRKKKKLSEESKSKEHNELESNEGKDDGQGKKRKKKKLSEESKSKEYNKFESNEGEDDGHGKKKKKKKNKKLSEESKSNEGEDDGQGKKRKKKKLSEESKSKEYNEFESNEGEDDGQGKQVEKKKLRDKSKNKENSEFNSNEGDVTESPNLAHSGSSKPKRVTFSDQVDICCDGLIRGKRFTPEEDDKIQKAVYDYIESHGLGDEGLDMVLHCMSHRQVRNCWKEIGAALPHRPHNSVYMRAHILFERGEKRKWTPEEYEFLRNCQAQHGSDWKTVAEALGKHRFHVKDTWRRIKLTNKNQGRWTQEEYQNLFNLVNQDLQVRASEEIRKSKHGMLRDNISWEAIGDKLTTRSSAVCCRKWYDKLTSPMVASGIWSDTDDYRLVNALYTLDACSMEEVDWDTLLEHRPGDVCRKRWSQMVHYIGDRGRSSFAEQVEVLAKRFCPDLLEAREAFDAKPVFC